MPRWKALPEDLDPQIKEFTERLRRLVDHSGLGVAALADRTGYGRASWERYLGGRLLAPKGAVVALAEATGTSTVPLITLWELAERAWSRADMRHDSTMDAIRVAQARQALDTPGTAGSPAPPGGRPEESGTGAREAVREPGRGARPIVDRPDLSKPDPVDEEGDGVRNSWRVARPDGVSASGGNSWGLAGYQGPSKAGRRAPVRADDASGTAGTAGTAGAPLTPSGTDVPATGTPGTDATDTSETSPTSHPAPSYAGQPAAPRPAPPAPPGNPGRQRLFMFLAGLVGTLVLIGGVLLVTGTGGEKKAPGRSPSPSAGSRVSLPPGVKCSGAACDGKDAEAMGCSGDLVTTAKSATLGGTVLEVRYSKTCGTAWGRITGAAQGDEVRLTVGGTRERGDITAVGDTIAYTPMVAVRDAVQAKACATLATGRTACTQ
ncbi:XRE family transcriptional regulator [Streptomyces sp. LP11]|uniref:XRE family transcriptional regulator n=1 Tax=Streptomyces pyxinicus TaxID=2970331 RepID=A0ABT2B8D2_9ACTN|nr:XRE family transcriptional regulator [Streptomyces sp. LP11]MCS0604774.1 XRE family transcriptional regulator [Streptomyces sp. LP11]